MKDWKVGVVSIKVFAPLRWDYLSTLVSNIMVFISNEDIMSFIFIFS